MLIVYSDKKPSFIKRASALLIDYCIILGYMGILAGLMFVLYLTTGNLPDWLTYSVTVAEILGFIVLVLPVGMYLYLSESSTHRATIGKRSLHLIVISNKPNTKLTRSQIAIRTIIKLLPWELAHFFVWHIVAATANGQNSFPLWLEVGLISCIIIPIIYVLMVAFQSKGRGPHDLIARTRVIEASI